jgi:hypothetical protein
MRPGTALFFRLQGMAALAGLIGGGAQWYQSGWRSAFLMFIGIVVLINLPLIWYAAKQKLAELRQRRRS